MSVSRLNLTFLNKLRRQHPDGYIRAINYHDTPNGTAENFRCQLQFFQKHFCSVTLADLDQFFETGIWHKDKPGLIISFDDGLRSNFEVAKPLLEEFGFCGWFFIPTDFIDCPAGEQLDFAQTHRINVSSETVNDGPVATSWDELRALDETHVIGCHTKSHCRFHHTLPSHVLKEEVKISRLRLENELGHKISTFCWVGGERESYSAEGARAIATAGYRYAFMTVSDVITARTNQHCLQRTNIESDWPLGVVGFQLSGILDRLYGSKRQAVLDHVANADDELAAAINSPTSPQ